MTFLTQSSNRVLHIDLETYSKEDIGDVGSYKYIDSPSFEILLFAYAFDDEDVKCIDLAQGEIIPQEVVDAIYDINVIKKAHNANFERTCLTKYFKRYCDPSEWECSAVHASELGLPRSLEDVGRVIGLSEDEAKMKPGKALIQYFCKPCKPTISNGGRTRNYPHHDIERWNLFKEYCKRDVETERHIDKYLSKFPSLHPMEKDLWNLDQKMNDAGVLVDTKMVDSILQFNNKYTAKLINAAKRLTGLDNPNSVTQVRYWLKQRGLNVDSLNKEAVTNLVKQIKGDERYKDVISYLIIRQELGKTSVKKYEAIVRSKCLDDKVRGMLLYYGANRTGRWAGRVVQLHNLPQNHLDNIEYVKELASDVNGIDCIELLYKSPMDVFSQLIRTAFIAGPKKVFAVADYSAIEARVIAWLAGEEWVNEVFRTHGKIYEATAAQMYHVPIEQVTKGSDLRKKGKVATLACGYQGGVGALSAMDRNGDIPDHEKQKVIEDWRKANKNIVKFWYDTEKNVKSAISNPGISYRGNKGLVFKLVNGSLFVKLPSGRFITYHNAKLIDGKICYNGVNQETRQWTITETYGGKLVENIVQATARDCLGCAMLMLDKAGYTPSFHIHDEVVIEVPEDKKDKCLDEIKDIMSLKDISWIRGLCLKAEGYTTPFYMKD